MTLKTSLSGLRANPFTVECLVATRHKKFLVALTPQQVLVGSI